MSKDWNSGGWDYRLIRHSEDIKLDSVVIEEVYYAIHEVYYKDNKAMSVTVKPIVLLEFSISESGEMLKMMGEAFKKDVLEYDGFKEGGYEDESE